MYLLSLIRVPQLAKKYPINGKNIPERGNVYRIESGSELTIPLVVPNENEKTFVIFTNDYQNADQIRQGLGFAFF